MSEVVSIKERKLVNLERLNDLLDSTLNELKESGCLVPVEGGEVADSLAEEHKDRLVRLKMELGRRLAALGLAEGDNGDS